MAGLTFNIFGHDVSASRTLKNVEGQAERSSKSIGGKFKGLGKTLVGAFAGLGAVSFFKGAFDEATEAQKVGAQTAAVLKSTGNAAHTSAKQIGDLATAISNKVGIDDEQIQSAANMLLTFRNLRNETGKGNDIFNQATKTLTDMSVATGKDMKSSAIQLGKALNDPIKGITALSRVGVTFSKGQQAQIKRLVATGQTMKAQKLILRELNSEFAGSAEAQATPAEKAKVAWANLQEQIGTQLLPVIGKLADIFAKQVVPALSAVFGWISKNQRWLLPLAGAIGAIVLVVKAWAVAQRLLNIVLATNPIVLIIAAIAALGVALVLAWKKSEKFRDIVKGVFNAVKVGALFLWHNVIEPVATGIGAAFKLIGTILSWEWHNIVEPVFAGIKAGIHAVHGVVHASVHAISGLWGVIGDGLAAAWGFIKKILDKIMAGIQHVKDALNHLNPFSSDFGLGGAKLPKNIQDALDKARRSGSGGSSASGPVTVQPRAFGGPVFAGMPYVVGERRPELFVPNQSGRIEPRAGRQLGKQITIENLTINQSNVVPVPSTTATPAAMRAASAALKGR